MEMHETKSRVYIKTDDKNRIFRCEGGYTISNIANIDEWIFVDEGIGDKYNLCQTHYFEDGLYTEDGIPLYKWDGLSVLERTEEEIEADRAELPKPTPDVAGEEITADDMAAAILQGVNEI